MKFPHLLEPRLAAARETAPLRLTWLTGVVVFAAFLVAVTIPGFESAVAGDTGFPRSWVRIVTASGSHEFTVELARDPRRRSLGLQHRTSLDAKAGMLFDFGMETRIAMWMKNTHVSLDMLFAAADGTVTHLAEHTKPRSLDIIEAPENARFVLEIPAGTAARLGIRRGDRLEGAALNGG